MAATTISRASLTDGVTVWNAATVGSAIYDKIDAVLAGAVMFGGVVGSEGFGTHTWSAGGTGGNRILLRNTTAGTGNFADLVVGNDTTANAVSVVAYSSTYTTSGPYVQDGALLQSTMAGGLSIVAGHASGDIRFYSGGTTEVGKFDIYGGLRLGYALHLTGAYDQTITGTQTLDSASQNYVRVRLTSCTSTPKISSCTAGQIDGSIKILVNVSGAACTVQHNGGGPTTRMYLANAADGTLGDDESMMLMYDAGTSSWIEIGPR